MKYIYNLMSKYDATHTSKEVMEAKKKKLAAMKRLSKTSQSLRDKTNAGKPLTVMDIKAQLDSQGKVLQAQINEIKPQIREHDFAMQDLGKNIDQLRAMMNQHGVLISDILLVMDIDDEEVPDTPIEGPEAPEEEHEEEEESPPKEEEIIKKLDKKPTKKGKKKPTKKEK